jgi:PAS domain S-box-containing protein
MTNQETQGAAEAPRPPAPSATPGTEPASGRVHQLNCLLRAIRGINQLIVRERDPQRLLNDACDLLIQTRGYALVWVGLVEPGAAEVRPAASAGRQVGYLDHITVTRDERPSGCGPVGSAIRTGRPRLCQDTATDPDFAPWRRVAAAHGLAALAAMPLVDGNRVLGALAVYADRAGAFDEDEVDLLSEVAGDLAYALQGIEHRQERQQAEDRLRVVNTALQSAANAIAITDRNGVITWVNPAFSRLTGYSLAELLGQTPNVLKSGAHDSEFYRRLWQTVLAGQVWRAEMVNRRKDGELYTEENTITPVRGEGGEITHFIAVKQDITERKRAEARLAAFSALGERLTSARTSQEAAVIIAEVADRLLGWDLYICKLYSAAEDRVRHVLGMDLINGRRTLCHPDQDAVPPSPLARRVIQRGGQLVLRDHSAAANGETRPFGDTSRPAAAILYVPVRHGAEVIGLISIQSYRPGAYNQHDLETLQALADHCGGTLARIRTEEDLGVSSERFRSVWEKSIDGMRLTDREGRILAVNEAYCQLVKLPRERLEGQLFSVTYQGQGPGESIDFYRERFDAAQISPHISTHTRLWTGEEVDLEISSSFLELGRQGRVLFSIFRNTTERRQLEAQLRQSQKLEGIGQLAGGVAHDFNNLLAVIRGNAELLLMDGDNLSDPAHEFLGYITGAAERAASLTRQLLIFSRKQTMQAQPVVLNDLIRNLTRMLDRVIREDIRLECVYGEPLPFVQADPGMMEQVLLNLVVNAKDAMARGGQLQIATRAVALRAEDVRTRPEARAGEFACLSVSDTGSGIAPEILPRIFEPFFTTKEVGRGSGLGLATVYGIVQEHRGWVEVASTVGQGTSFHIFLPAIPAPAPADLPGTEATGLCAGTETILMVEDEYSVRTITRRVLETLGYKVHEAGSGPEAIEIWQRHAGEIALLLTDMVMPDGFTGLRLSDQLRSQKPGLKVVYMSGYSAEVVGVDSEFMLRNKSRFLHKPCSAEQLSRTVRKCLDEP